MPNVGDVKHGQPLFYKGEINTVFGESGAGKSWTALVATQQQLSVGNQVVYIDYESHPRNIVERLRALKVTKSELSQLIYKNPDTKISRAGMAELVKLAATTELVVIDSVGEALAMEGLDPNADEKVADWFQRIPKPLARAGAAVVVLDHVTKASDTTNMFAIGSQRKRAAVTGAAYRQNATEPFTKSKSGYSELLCAKDRHGNYAYREKVAQLHYVTGEGFTLMKPIGSTPKPESADDRDKRIILDNQFGRLDARRSR